MGDSGGNGPHLPTPSPDAYKNLSSPFSYLYTGVMVMILKKGVRGALCPSSGYPTATAPRLRSRLAKASSPDHGTLYGLIAGAAAQIRSQQLPQSLRVIDELWILLQRTGA
jgi:hypothetical protein